MLFSKENKKEAIFFLNATEIGNYEFFFNNKKVKQIAEYIWLGKKQKDSDFCNRRQERQAR